jgi:hypothetical protein
MGQYGNQPDFGSIARNVTPQADAIFSASSHGPAFPPSALYIATGGSLVCRVVGGNANTGGVSSDGFNTGWTWFENIPDGTFLPVIVDYVWASASAATTTCAGIIALR